MKSIENVLFKYKAFIKHVPIPDRPKYIDDLIGRHGAKYIATDYTSFESSFVSEVMQVCEKQLYTYMAPTRRKQVLQFMDIIGGINICKFKTCKTTIRGKRMSGEMNTSVANGFTNLMLMEYCCSKIGSKCAGVV
jgi:hypothetical protein